MEILVGLQNTPLPGQRRSYTKSAEHTVSLDEGSVEFMGFGGLWFARGVYTDIGGALNTVADVNVNKTITVNGRRGAPAGGVPWDTGAAA